MTNSRTARFIETMIFTLQVMQIRFHRKEAEMATSIIMMWIMRIRMMMITPVTPLRL